LRPPSLVPLPLKKKTNNYLDTYTRTPSRSITHIEREGNVRTKSFKKTKNKTNTPNLQQVDSLIETETREQQNSLACFCLVENFLKERKKNGTRKKGGGVSLRRIPAGSGADEAKRFPPGQMISFFLCVCVCVVHLKKKNKKNLRKLSLLFDIPVAQCCLAFLFFYFKQNVSVQLFNFFQNF
jgi:hypothetical protein